MPPSTLTRLGPRNTGPNSKARHWMRTGVMFCCFDRDGPGFSALDARRPESGPRGIGRRRCKDARVGPMIFDSEHREADSNQIRRTRLLALVLCSSFPRPSIEILWATPSLLINRLRLPEAQTLGESPFLPPVDHKPPGSLMRFRSISVATFRNDSLASLTKEGSRAPSSWPHKRTSERRPAPTAHGAPNARPIDCHAD